MTEEEARERVRILVGDDGVDRLDRMARLVVAENERQNLVSRSSVAHLWVRHILDSVQLVQWAPSGGVWMDIGTGGGFPGLAIAAATPRPMMLVEPRRKRADFLKEAAAALGLREVSVLQRKVGQLSDCQAQVISARAVAPIAELVLGSIQCATSETRWILPRGASYDGDMAIARSSIDAVFHVEHSITDPAAAVVIVTQVKQP